MESLLEHNYEIRLGNLESGKLPEAPHLQSKQRLEVLTNWIEINNDQISQAIKNWNELHGLPPGFALRYFEQERDLNNVAAQYGERRTVAEIKALGRNLTSYIDLCIKQGEFGDTNRLQKAIEVEDTNKNPLRFAKLILRAAALVRPYALCNDLDSYDKSETAYRAFAAQFS